MPSGHRVRGARWRGPSTRFGLGLGLGLALALGLAAPACDDAARVLDRDPRIRDGAEVGAGEGGARGGGGGGGGGEVRLPDDQRGSDAGWVFDEDAVREYQLTLEPEAWAALKASALTEEYFPARLSIDGAPYGVVGLRFKGSRGTLGRCADNRGNLRCRKLSMKLKFDAFDGDQRFFGLKRLNFNSMLSDATELHERLAYQLFREMGVPAPRAAHARLAVNGEKLGVFSLVEQIDGRFTDDRFAGGDGNLYKEQWPITGSKSALDASLETNEEAPDHSALVQFHAELAAATPDTVVDVVSRYMDMDELLAYLAVDRIIGNWDGFSSFYCRGGGCYNHNFYLYQHEHEARFSVVPWDLDNTFRVWSSFESVPMPLVRPSNCSRRYPIFTPMRAKAAGCDPIFFALGLLDRERYRSTLQRLLDGPFDLARLDAWLDARVEQLSPYVAEDTHAPSLSYFLVAVEALRNDLRFLAERAVAEQDGARLPYFRLALDGVNDFEATTPLGLRLGSEQQTAGGSQATPLLREGDAIDGQRELDVEFAFPASTEEERWARVRLLLAGDIADLNARKGVRLELQADAPRTVRIAIDSQRYALFESRAVFGWDVALDGSRQTIELAFADASYPEWGPDAFTLAEALSQATALLIEPKAIEPKVVELEDRARGFADAPDIGRIRIDRISFTP